MAPQRERMCMNASNLDKHFANSDSECDVFESDSNSSYCESLNSTISNREKIAEKGVLQLESDSSHSDIEDSLPLVRFALT